MLFIICPPNDFNGSSVTSQNSMRSKTGLSLQNTHLNSVFYSKTYDVLLYKEKNKMLHHDTMH